MEHVLDLPQWALLMLGLIAGSGAVSVLYLTAQQADHEESLHRFKVDVITLRNEHMQRLEALYSGRDDSGSAAALFTAEDPLKSELGQAAPPAQQAA